MSLLESLKPSFRQFPRVPVGRVELPAVAGVAVEAQTERFEGATNNFLDPSALTTVSGKLGRLTPQQFAGAQEAFGSRSQVPYEASRGYEVVDFLPPLVQALVNQDLQIPEPVKLAGSAVLELLPLEEDKTVDLTMNCHAAAWEASRSYQVQAPQANIFLAEMISMDDLAHSESFQALGEVAGPEALKPGDLVQFYEKSDWARMTMLLHSVTYVGDGLFFEKPNTESAGEDAPFRLATWNMVTQPVASYSEGRYRTEAFRPQQPLEDSLSAFGSGSAEAVENWAREHGETLGKPLCVALEQSMGGGIRGEGLTALAAVPLGIDASGRGCLKA